LASPKALSDFLKDVERRAYQRTLYHVRNHESALDIVQDSMMRLAEHYGDKPADELPLLFQRILVNATMDWFRRQKTQHALFTPYADFQSDDDSGDDVNPLEFLPVDSFSLDFDNPQSTHERKQTLLAIEEELLQLAPRQREAFLLRYWEGLDIAETAHTMGCSQGSVKVHCFRAIQSLFKTLTAKGFKP